MSQEAQTLALRPHQAVIQRRWVLLACILATCARNLEPPPWIYRPPVTDAFNQAWSAYGIVNGLYSLGLLALILVGGVIGDLLGRRRMLLVGLAGLVISNLLWSLTPAVPWFIFTRILAGAFGAIILPLSLSILYLEFADEPEARKQALSVYVLVTSTAFLISGVVGMLIYGALDWRAPLVLPTILGVIAFVMISRLTKESRVHVEYRFDVIGHMAWALLVLSSIGGLIAWVSYGRYAQLGLILALVGLVVGVGMLVWSDWYTRGSLLLQPQIKRRALVVLILFGLAMQFGFVGYVMQIRNVLLGVYGYSAILVTFALAPLLLGMLVMTIYTAKRLATANPRILMTIGLLVSGAVCGLTVLTKAVAFYPWLAILLAVFGAGIMLAMITWTATFLTAMPEEVVGVRTGINNVVFQMGGILGNLVPSVLLVRYGSVIYARMLALAGVPQEQITDAIQNLNMILNPLSPDPPLAADMADRLLAGYQIAYIDAYERVLLLIAVVCAFGAAVVWFGLMNIRWSAIFKSADS